MKTEPENIIDVNLQLLPGYASYILNKRLDGYVKKLYDFSMSLDIPLLRFFKDFEETEILKLSLDGTKRLLLAIQDNTISEYVEWSKTNWLHGQLPVISKEDVIVEDISLINYARKKALRYFLPDYAKDPAEILIIMDEIDQFMLCLDAAFFKTHLKIQHERLALSNQELKKREQELLEAQALGKIGSFEWDLTGNKNSRYTPELFKIFSMQEQSNLDSFLNHVHKDDRLKVQAAIEKALAHGDYECEYRYDKNGVLKILHSRGKVFFENGRPLKMVGTVTDVTEKAGLIKRLIENEEFSKQAQALTSTGSWKWTIDEDTIEWSDEMYRIYGLRPQSEKITFQRFLTFIHDNDRSKRLAEITEALKTGKASDYIMRINTQDGKVKVLKGRGKVLIDKSGKSTGMLGTCQDITNEYFLTGELRAKNEELIRKNKDLESFNFIASHDLQEPLRKIQIYSNRILHESQQHLPENLLKYFEKISQASNRMQRMIEDFLTFYYTMNTVEITEAISLNELVTDASRDLRELIANKKANLVIEENAVITGSKKHLSLMLKHLIGNALKFSYADRNPEIKITSTPDRGADGKPYTLITISDNGIGFDPKYADRIFELFQRLHSKDEYSGSGIGLSLCKKIAEDHNGHIAATSAPGNGSTFNVYLPLVAAAQ